MISDRDRVGCRAHPGPASFAIHRPHDAVAQEAHECAPTGAGGPGAPDPSPHARQLTLGNVLAPVAGLPGSSIVLFVPKVGVRSVPSSHVPGAATRGFPAPHQLAHQVRVVAVLLGDPQVVERTERSRHRLREAQVPVLGRVAGRAQATRATGRTGGRRARPRGEGRDATGRAERPRGAGRRAVEPARVSAVRSWATAEAS
jgi:hypothetical protein